MRYEVAGYDPIAGLNWVRDTTQPHGEDFVSWAKTPGEAQRIANNLNELSRSRADRTGEETNASG